jgi:hypothetical protein
MPIIPNQHAGIVLTGEFDRSSPDYAKDIADFTSHLADLQAKQKFPDFISIKREEGRTLIIQIIPCKLGPVPAGAAEGPGAATRLHDELATLAAPEPTNPEEADWGGALAALQKNKQA